MPRVIAVDLMLLNWSETANGGAKLVFQLSDPDDLAHFKPLTLAKGKRAGQLFSAALALLDDEPEDDQGHDDRAPGPRCQLAGRWCKEPDFRAWLGIEYPDVAASVVPSPAVQQGEQWAAEIVRKLLGVASRREIDRDPDVAKKFDVLLREPYSGFQRAIG